MSKQEEVLEQQLIRYLNGEATIEERQLVDTWKATSAENQTYFDTISEVWKNTENAKDFDTIDVDQQWDLFKKSTAISTKRSPVFYLSTGWKVAAAIVVLIGMTFYFTRGYSDQIRLVAASGQENRFELPDGSLVWLNEASELSYTKNFGGEDAKTRALELNGEAYFEVVHNPKKPFEVQVNETKTQVLGTSFNLKEDQDAKKVSLVLLTGKVAFSNRKTEEIVHPGERIISNANGELIKAKNNKKNFLAWKTKVLVFENRPLEEALQEIANFYKITIAINEEQLRQCTVTIKLNNERLEEVMETLKTLYNVSYSKDASGNYKLIGGGC